MTDFKLDFFNTYNSYNRNYNKSIGNIQNKNEHEYEYEEFDDFIIKALVNKINSKGYNINYNNIKYLDKGGEARIFLINNKIAVKVYCSESSLARDSSSLFNDIKKQNCDLDGINGSLKSLGVDKINIKGCEFVIQYFKYMENQTLYKLINNIVDYDYSSMFPIAFKLVLNLYYLHRNGIAHYDIKPENIFINSKGNPKIGDFSFMEKIGFFKSIFKGSIGYIAPELYSREYIETSDKIDIYSLGVMFFYMFANSKGTKNYINFTNNNYFDYVNYNFYLLNELFRIIGNKKLMQEIKLLASDEIKIKLLSLIGNMIAFEPENRPTIEEVKNTMVEIYSEVKGSYKTYKINGKSYNFKIKNREKLNLFQGEELNFKNIIFQKEEIMKVEKNIGKRIVSFLNSEDASDEFKSNLSKILNAIFPNNDFLKFNNQILTDMYPREKKILSEITMQFNTLKYMKIVYIKKCKIKEEKSFFNTLSNTLDEFNNIEEKKEQEKD